MKQGGAKFEDAISRHLLNVQCRLLQRKYGAAAVLFVRSISTRDLSIDQLRLIKPILIFLSGWIKISKFFLLVFSTVRIHFLAIFDHSFLYEICLFFARGVALFISAILVSKILVLDDVKIATAIILACLYLVVAFYMQRHSPLKWIYLAFTQSVWLLFFLRILGWSFT